MTPGGMLPNPAQTASPSTAYNSISSAATPSDSGMDSVQKPKESPVEQLLAKFSSAFNAFTELTGIPDYAGATDEANAVKKAMNQWLSAVADKLPSTQNAPNGGESPQTNSAGSPTNPMMGMGQ